MKKVLVIIGLCALAAYLVFAAFYFEEKPKEEICNHFEIVTTDDEVPSMVDLAEVEKDVDEKGMNPYGKPLKEVNTYNIEQAILSHKMIKKANVFITSSGGIRAEIEERQPIMRVITSSGENYYIDKDGQKVPLSQTFVADLPLATGVITDSLAQTKLYEFSRFLSENEFWDNFIEQIVVLPQGDVKLIPRVGNNEIILGKIDDFQEKLNKLKIFYEKGLSEVGWNRYSTINLKYNKQVVGTKR